MINLKFVALLVLSGLLLGSLSDSPLRAAPDNTLGMALMSATVAGQNPPSIIRGSGALSVSRFQVGTYDVVFDRNLSNCSCMANVGEYSIGSFTSGFVATASCPFAANSARVAITGNGVLADNADFHLIVFCSK